MALPLSLFDRPAPRPSVRLWPHQERQHAAVFAEFAKPDIRSTLVVSATGTGKTTLLSSIAKETKGGVLVIAHRDEILTQLQQRLELVTGEGVDREQADFRSGNARIVVASIQTICRESRLTRFPRDRFSIVIVDEAHHACATSYRAVLAYFEKAKVLGVTATPDRGDRLALGQEFDSVANVYDISDAIADGVLCPVDAERVPLDVDLSQINTVAGDLNQGQLDEAMGDEHVLEGVAGPCFERAGDRRTVVFTTSVLNAHKLAQLFNDKRQGCARAVDGGMDIDNRRAVLAGYARGDFQFLCNVMIATEGWDDPPTSCVAIGRPTKSRALYTQMVGRGLRVHPGKKDCLVLDFAGNAGKHALVSPFDILAGKYSDEEITLAKELGDKPRAQREPVNVLLEMAREELKRRAQRQVKARFEKYDPFTMFDVHTEEADWQFGFKPPTDKQREVLERKGVKVGETMSRRQASALLDKLFKRQNEGKASYKQMATLAKSGITDTDISFAQASELITALKDNRWRPLPLARVNSILGAQEPGWGG